MWLLTYVKRVTHLARQNAKQLYDKLCNARRTCGEYGRRDLKTFSNTIVKSTSTRRTKKSASSKSSNNPTSGGLNTRGVQKVLQLDTLSNKLIIFIVDWKNYTILSYVKSADKMIGSFVVMTSLWRHCLPYAKPWKV